MMNEETKASLNKFLKEREERIKNMTLAEARGVLGDVRAYLASRASLENEMLAGHTFTDICNAIKALEQTRWIPVNEIGYPKPEDEYKHFITIDNKGEITIQEFLLSLDEEPQPYFTGMRNIVAYINMPLPEPYKEGKE